MLVQLNKEQQHKRFPVIEETKLIKNWGEKNAEFPHGKAITINWGNQFLDEFSSLGTPE